MAEGFPRRFGKYVLLKPLARGGMGEIYLAASGELGGFEKLCVVKKVLTEKADQRKTNRFLDEAKVVLRLSHVNLVSTFDVGEVQGELYIAMELVDGKDLRDIWNRCVRTRTRIPLDVALYVTREVARALAYVHTFGDLRLVHRDVAPPNILISYFGEVKLTDFGLARSVLKQEHTAPGVVFGRASYLAPEQARGEVADGRTDVYSLGIILWELLTGQPYLQLAGLDPVTSLSLVRHPKPQAPSTRAPWIGPELDAIVMQALAPDRSHRFQTAEELRRALSDVISRLAPRADSERAADFLRGLCRDVIAEEIGEREVLLNEMLPAFRGQVRRESLTPATAIMADRVPVGSVAPASAPLPESDRGAHAQENGAHGYTGGLAAAFASASASALAAAPALHAGPERRTRERLAGTPAASVANELAEEPLHVAALRARKGTTGSALAAPEPTPADPPTTVWRRPTPLPANGLATAFLGRVIDNRYRIKRKIGEGGMGTVYAGEHVEIGKGVAIKILHPLFSGQQLLFERFRREARAASRVGHPHIVDVTDFGTTEEGCAYFVMEQLEGMDLADALLHEGRLDLTRAVRIAVQICRALEAAHAAGVIHRDLKPENVFLVARDGQPDFVKVLDFGIARSASAGTRRLTSPGMAMGTPEYMAPEQAHGHPADRRTDVYAVGALLYEMLLGTAPFKAASHEEMLELKRRPPPSLSERRPEIPEPLEAIIVQALDADPTHRPQTMAHLEYELTKIVWGRREAVAQLLGMRDGSAGWDPVTGSSVGRERTGQPEVTRQPEVPRTPEPGSGERRSAAYPRESQELVGSAALGSRRTPGRLSVPAIAAFSGSGVVFDVPTHQTSSGFIVDPAVVGGGVDGDRRRSRTTIAAVVASFVLIFVGAGLVLSSTWGKNALSDVRARSLYRSDPPPMRGGLLETETMPSPRPAAATAPSAVAAPAAAAAAPAPAAAPAAAAPAEEPVPLVAGRENVAVPQRLDAPTPEKEDTATGSQAAPPKPTVARHLPRSRRRPRPTAEAAGAAVADDGRARPATSDSDGAALTPSSAPTSTSGQSAPIEPADEQ